MDHDDGCTIHGHTAKNKTRPWVLPEHEKEQKFNTWYVTRHRTRALLWTAPCPAGRLPPLWVARPNAGCRCKKNNTNRSILSDKKKTRVICGEHARKSSAKKRAKKHTPFSLVKAQLTNCQQGQQKKFSLNKKHFDHFSIEHRQISCDHLPFKSGPTRFICPPHYCHPRRPPEGSPFFHPGAWRQIWTVCSSAPCPPLQRCQKCANRRVGRIGPHRCFSRHQETLRSMRHA